jgi:hypothetical protein
MIAHRLEPVVVDAFLMPRCSSSIMAHIDIATSLQACRPEQPRYHQTRMEKQSGS